MTARMEDYVNPTTDHALSWKNRYRALETENA
jgi:hypothetical protein